MPYQLLADIVLALHVSIVVFVVLGLLVVVVGNLCEWRWVNALCFRLSHLVAIAVIVAESWAGITCPLTNLENSLREKAQMAAYTGSFIEHWISKLLFYEAPAWVFALAYSGFGILVLFSWWKFPPKRLSE